MYKSKKKIASNQTVIHAAALQDHILRNINLSLKPLLFRPKVPRIEPLPPPLKLPKLPKSNHTQFKFEEQEEQFKQDECEQEMRVKKAYNRKLSLAQKLGLVAAPPKPMSLEEWESVEELSKKRDDGLCPICLEAFRNQEHTILSCSHVFHKTCLESLEKYTKIKVCPICRRQDYEKKRYIHAHRTFALSSVIKIQSCYRGFRGRVKFYEDMLGRAYKPTSLRLKRRLMFYKLAKVTSKISRQLAQKDKQVQETVDMLSQAYDEKKNITDLQIQQILVIKQNNPQIDQLEVVQSKLSEEQWQLVREKALQRCDKDCVICFQALQKDKKGVYLLSCTHCFHAACLNAFERYSVKTVTSCPICRAEYEKMHMLCQ